MRRWFGKKWVKICLVVLVAAALMGLAWNVGKNSQKSQPKTSTPAKPAATPASPRDYSNELKELKEMVANLGSTGNSAQQAQPPQPVTVTVNPVVNVTVTQTVNGKESQSSWQQSSEPSSILNGDFKGKVYDSGGWYVGSFRESTIDHFWGSAGPKNRTDNFSVIWEGSFSVPESGNYCFKVVADGGIQLLVDDYLMIDEKSLASQSVVEHTSAINLTAGSHKVVLKYYETTGDATCRLLYGKN